jgi:hypothetical protein
MIPKLNFALILSVCLCALLPACKIDQKDDFCPPPCAELIQTFDKDGSYYKEPQVKVLFKQAVYDNPAANQKTSTITYQIKNVSGKYIDSVKVLISVYKSGQFTYDNLLLTQAYVLVDSLKDQDTTSVAMLTTVVPDIIAKENVVVEIIQLAKDGVGFPHPFAGLYSGKYFVYTGLDTNAVLKYFKTCSGNVNADGTFRFSLDGDKEYRLAEGELSDGGVCIGKIKKADGADISSVVTVAGQPATLQASSGQGSDSLALHVSTSSQIEDFSFINFSLYRIKP